MAQKKRAFLTGITGQDGSYLAEHLLGLGYEIGGFIRSSSTGHLGNIEHLRDEIKFFRGSLDDETSIEQAIATFEPDEIYNLGAEAAPFDSFKRPVYTSDINALGPLRMFEAANRLRKRGKNIKVYQASTSEMFGAPPEVPQNEKTPMIPANPYGVAKLFAHLQARILRNGSEKMPIWCGILFNHECLTAQTPVIIRKPNGLINIVAIEELVPHREDPTKGSKYITIANEPIEIWDGDNWTKVKTLTATWNKANTPGDKEIMAIESRGGYYEATSDHISFLDGQKAIKTGEIKTGDNLELKALPSPTNTTILTMEEAEFLGMIVADGYINQDGKGRFINSDPQLRAKIKTLWEMVSGGNSKDDSHPSGFSDKKVESVEFSGNRDYLRFVWTEIYNEKLFKKVPKRIINSQKEIQIAFLKGYNSCDGLKAGRQKTEFKCFTTNSQVLALGLWYLVYSALNLRITLHPEYRKDKFYFHLNINSDNQTMKGKHMVKTLNEVKKMKHLDYTGWLFDLETESGTFSAGIGLTWVHNSPRRGMQYVTRKVTVAVACIKNKVKNPPLNELGMPIITKNYKLEMGNLEAKRDWGFAKEYVEVMHKMLQTDNPDEYIVATGETHSIQELVEVAFGHVGLNWQDHVVINPEFVRPLETGPLCGDASKIKEALGWEPKVRFEELIKLMVDSDLARFS